MTKVTPFLMFNDQLEAAMEFYTATFPDSEIRNVARTGKDGPITSAEFVVGGQVFMGYNGGPYFTFSEGFSLYVDCEDQARSTSIGTSSSRPERAYGVRLDQGPVRPLLADRPEAIHGAHPRQGPQEGEGRDGGHDDDGEARRGGP
jgi:hypothetical protein